MPTPHPDPSTATLAGSGSSSDRGALRLHMTRQPGRDTLDGGWWPHSRDLVVELTDLVDHFPERFGRVTRVLVSPRDWDLRARAVAVSGRYVKVGPSPNDDTHLVLLSTSRRTLLRVLVVPPDVTTDQGEEALLAAATHGNSHSAQDLLDTVTEHPDVDPRDHWAHG